MRVKTWFWGSGYNYVSDRVNMRFGVRHLFLKLRLDVGQRMRYISVLIKIKVQVCVCAYAGVCVCAYAGVCVRERERKRERGHPQAKSPDKFHCQIKGKNKTCWFI